LSKGLAGVKTLTAKQIADKWKLPLAVVAKKIAAGVKVEKEHTTSTRQANEIARDHLGERPDYYDKLHKMEKTKVVKENTTVTTGIGGLGFNTGTPAIAADNEYIDTNSMSYEDWNGAILKMIKDKHDKHLIDMGFTSYSPNDLQTASNKVMKEAKLNELGEYDNKGGMSGYEGTSGPIRAVRKNEMTPIKEKSTGNTPADMSSATARGIYEVSAEKVGQVHLRYLEKNKPVPDFVRRAVVKKWLESKVGKIPEKEKSEKKEPKTVKEEDNTKPDVNLMGNQKPDAYGYGAKGTTKTIHEETKMDNKELINEALDCILEDNLPEMKDNLMRALQEKAMEKLEERKKEIAANYFAQ
jgi:Protein of unknown function (DUF5661)